MPGVDGRGWGLIGKFGVLKPFLILFSDFLRGIIMVFQIFFQIFWRIVGLNIFVFIGLFYVYSIFNELTIM